MGAKLRPLLVLHDGQCGQVWVLLAELHPWADLPVVLVAPLVLFYVGSQVRVHHADVGVVEAETNSHTAFVALATKHWRKQTTLLFLHLPAQSTKQEIISCSREHLLSFWKLHFFNLITREYRAFDKRTFKILLSSVDLLDLKKTWFSYSLRLFCWEWNTVPPSHWSLRLFCWEWNTVPPSHWSLTILPMMPVPTVSASTSERCSACSVFTKHRSMMPTRRTCFTWEQVKGERWGWRTTTIVNTVGQHKQGTHIISEIRPLITNCVSNA